MPQLPPSLYPSRSVMGIKSCLDVVDSSSRMYMPSQASTQATRLCLTYCKWRGRHCRIGSFNSSPQRTRNTLRSIHSPLRRQSNSKELPNTCPSSHGPSSPSRRQSGEDLGIASGRREEDNRSLEAGSLEVEDRHRLAEGGQGRHSSLGWTW